jgi:hypothetical protein
MFSYWALEDDTTKDNESVASVPEKEREMIMIATVFVRSDYKQCRKVKSNTSLKMSKNKIGVKGM